MSYWRFGTGTRLLVCLHGFGDRGAMFLRLAEQFGDTFTICALDLPHHGHSIWREPFFNGIDLRDIIRHIVAAEGFERFELMGYSFGGRILQRMIWHFAARLDRLYLLAPDGLQTRWMFEISMTPRWTRRMLGRLLARPTWFLRILEWFYRRGLINDFIYQFTIRHLHRKDRQERLFCYWLSMDDFVIAPDRVRQKIRRERIPTDLFFGTTDKLVPYSMGEWLAKDSDGVIQLYAVESGHKIIGDAFCAVFEKVLLAQPKQKQ